MKHINETINRDHMHDNFTVVFAKNGGVGFITDGEVDTRSMLFLQHPSSLDTSKVLYPLIHCTYVVYGDEDTGEIFVEAEDEVDQEIINKAIAEMKNRLTVLSA